MLEPRSGSGRAGRRRADGRIDTVTRRRLTGAALLLAAVFVAATAWLFVWPARGAPAHADAIVMLSGSGARLNEAVRLAEAHVAPNLVVSMTSAYWAAHGRCAEHIPGVTLTCFTPSPISTQGEAEYVGRLAARNHWHSVVLVTTTPQDKRARLRVERCFSGHVYVATASISTLRWIYSIAYEWAASFKAVVLQRGC